MLFAIDLDGCLYRENQVIKGAVQTIEILKKNGNIVVFVTNNATLSREGYVRKLKKLGFPCKKEEVMCAAYATSMYLAENNGTGKKAYVVGEDGLFEELFNFKIKVSESSKVDYVVVGLDRNFNYRKLLKASDAVRSGAEFIASNADATWPGKNGRIYPGGGAVVKAISEASGVKPKIIGKPKPYMLKKILEYFNVKQNETIVIGDRIETDILFGKNAGTKTALVLTGITTREMLKNLNKNHMPDYILNSINDILKQ